MLHRITMRILPALTMAVTEDALRKRKRILMLFPGLLAYALYKSLHAMTWHADIAILLLAGGLFSSGVAIVCYAYGRQRNLSSLVAEDGFGRAAWIMGRVGFLYAIQLSLMVLGLLQALSYFWGYLSYAVHPAAPAMMALIISSTSVARDAFEIGHLRLLQQQGRLFASLPDGKALWALLVRRPDLWASPVILATLIVGFGYTGLALLVPQAQTDLGNLAAVGVLVGVSGTLAFLRGLRPGNSVWEGFGGYTLPELLRFFWWPGLTFAWTYFLIVLGALHFLLGLPHPPFWARVVVTAGIGALMSLYCYYLGRSRWQEEKLHATISPALLRCPFILGVLTSKKA
jgi:hypothetical protein